jgi:tetratricopeptide (TPR) repeat protein
MYWLGLIMLLIPRQTIAQSSEIIRLRGLVLNELQKKNGAADTMTINNLDFLAHAFYGINADSSFFYSKKALEYAEKIHYAKGQSESWRLSGNAYKLTGDYTNMLSCYYQAMTIAEEIHNPTLIGKVNMNIAIFYEETGKYDEALAMLDKAARIYQDTGDSLQLAYVLSNISDAWYMQQDYIRALEYAQQALQISKKLKNDYSIAFLNNDVGKMLAGKGQWIITGRQETNWERRRRRLIWRVITWD